MSENVSAGLEFTRPDEELVKAQIVVALRNAMIRKKLTQTEASKRLDLAKPDITRLVNRRVAGFSLVRMLGFIAALGHDVKIHVRASREQSGCIMLAA